MQKTEKALPSQALEPDILKMMQEDMDKGHNMSLELAEFYTEIQPDHDKALQYALNEYEKRPENIDVNRRLAKIYALKNDMVKAKEHFSKASVTRSKHPELAELKKMLGS